MYDNVLELASLLLVLLAVWLRVRPSTRRWAPRHLRVGPCASGTAGQAEPALARTRSMKSPTAVPDSSGCRKCPARTTV